MHKDLKQPLAKTTIAKNKTGRRNSPAGQSIYRTFLIPEFFDISAMFLHVPLRSLFLRLKAAEYQRS